MINLPFEEPSRGPRPIDSSDQPFATPTLAGQKDLGHHTCVLWQHTITLMNVRMIMGFEPGIPSPLLTYQPGSCFLDLDYTYAFGPSATRLYHISHLILISTMLQRSAKDEYWKFAARDIGRCIDEVLLRNDHDRKMSDPR